MAKKIPLSIFRRLPASAKKAVRRVVNGSHKRRKRRSKRW